MIAANTVLKLTAEQKIAIGRAGIYEQIRGGGMIIATIQLDDTVRVSFVPTAIAEQIIEFADSQPPQPQSENAASTADIIRISARASKDFTK